jgi:hypothetical protein
MSTVAMLTDDQLEELLGLVKRADSVELKLTVPDKSHRATVTALQADPLEAEIRQVFFFDTPDLQLDRHGVVVRARRTQRKGDDSVVKLRPIVPDTLPADVRSSPSFVVEVDAMPGAYVCSGSMKGVPTVPVRETLFGNYALRKLFTKEQRAFFAAHAPEGIVLDDLSVLGPLFVLKLRLAPKTLGRKLVGEMWLYPDGSRVIELSTKCAPGEALHAAAELRVWLRKTGVDSSGEQQTKTRKALEFFSAELQAQGADASEGDASVAPTGP